ncbi:hypothetical protein LMG8526_1873 [Lactococcus lactis subsp. lactis]|nr:hypothetical protein LMG8526_1873 [Lactococcus lactis subsp. lactis]
MLVLFLFEKATPKNGLWQDDPTVTRPSKIFKTIFEDL